MTRIKKRIKSIILPTSEESVRHLFSLHSKELGFEILNIQKAFPDCTAIDYSKAEPKEVDIELEFNALNFVAHGHINQMLPDREYIIVCWTLKSRRGIPQDIEIIVLEEMVDIVSPSTKQIQTVMEKPIYSIISYNPSLNKQPIEIWEEIKIFRTNTKFKGNRIPRGSVIVLHSKGKLVGEFTVAKYHYLEKPPSTDEEIRFYNLTAFPIGFSEDPMVDPMIKNNNDWLKGHIVYYNFKKYDPPVPLDVLKKKLSGYGRLNIDYEDLQRIRGKR